MNDLCRLCASTKPFNRLTIQIKDSILNVEEKLIACCQWKKYAHDDDKLPDAICFDCYEKLQECWLFSTSIEKSQAKLRKILHRNFQTTTRVKHELKTEDDEFNQSETELENINIFVEPLTTTVALDEQLDQPITATITTDETICDGRQLLNVSPTTTTNTLEVKNSDDLTGHLKNTDAQRTKPNEIIESIGKQPDELLKYACNECGHRFRLKCRLNAHRLVHSTERPFECWLCHKTYKRRKELSAHIAMHTEFFECHKCCKNFLKKAKRNNHMEKRHGIINRDKKSSVRRVKQFTCEMCGHSYCHREGLSRHLQSAHSDKWPYKCEVCGMGFKIKNGLHGHRKKHTEHQHKCDQCGQAFRKRISLRRHLEYHTGSIVKPFACDYCEKSFRLNVNLMEHRRIHTGEKPHICDHCPSTFRTLSSFCSHLRKEHGISVSAQKQAERARAAAMSSK